jgi:hypothetical protein
MSRLLFGVGAKGATIQKIQQKLIGLGLLAGNADGDYGNKTKTAITSFQQSKGLPETGEVDETTWTTLTNEPVPPVSDRALALTATFEGHGFTLAQGNFDGAGITWGIIGFTLKGGELGKILKDAYAQDPDLVRSCFADKTDELLAHLDEPWDQQLAWADSISTGSQKAGLAEPWKSAFAKLGSTELAQRLQSERVQNAYYKPALQTAEKWGLKTELGAALCFDIHVQNGGIGSKAAEKINAALTPDISERDKRILIANCVADNAIERWREDVRERKLAIATGEGSVHGSSPFVLRNWGLDDLEGS